MNQRDGRLGNGRLAMLVLVVLALLVAACGDDSEDDSSADGSTTTTAELTGPPIPIGVIVALSGQGSSFPSVPEGAKAAVKEINANGGINGSPLELKVCDTGHNTNQEVQCAKDMVAAKVAFSYVLVRGGDLVAPIFNEAKTPYLVGSSSSAAEFTTPVVFPLSATGFVQSAAAGAICAKLDAKKIGIAQIDAAAAEPLTKSIQGSLKPFGLSAADTNVVKVPATAVDMSSYAASLSSNDCTGTILTPAQTPLMVQAIHQANPEQPVVAGTTGPLETWEKLGKLAENTYVAGYVPWPTMTSAPGIKQYLASMKAHNGAKSDTLDQESVASWSGVQLAAKVMKSSKATTGPALLEALNSAGTLDVPPLAPFDYGKLSDFFPGLRIFTTKVVIAHFNAQGELEPNFDGEYVDSTSLASAGSLKDS